MIYFSSDLHLNHNKPFLYEPRGFKDIYIIPTVVGCSLEDAKTRNAFREGKECVPNDVLDNMFNSMTDPKTDPFKYDGILYLYNRLE